MHQTVGSRPSVGSRRQHWQLWLLAIVFFGIGDILSSLLGFATPGIVEIGPLVAPLVAQYGVIAMVVLKVAALAVGIALWWAIPGPEAIGIPIGLIILGILVTTWNLLMVVWVTM